MMLEKLSPQIELYSEGFFRFELIGNLILVRRKTFRLELLLICEIVRFIHIYVWDSLVHLSVLIYKVFANAMLF